MLLGCIADDFTGASDLANTLARGAGAPESAHAGMAVTQFIGVPEGPAPATCEAGVVALKTRSIPAAEAVAQSLAALAWLERQGCRQFLFKYCSTFDSTPEGNIGPVAEALAERLGAKGVIVCPAFPGTGRTVYMGHLFVNDRLLSESGMEKASADAHDPDIRRWLRRQTESEVGHVPHAIVAQSAQAIRIALNGERLALRTLVVVDAVSDSDLIAIGAAADGDRLITGGSGIARGLPANFRKAGLIGQAGSAFSPKEALGLRSVAPARGPRLTRSRCMPARIPLSRLSLISSWRIPHCLPALPSRPWR